MPNDFDGFLQWFYITDRKGKTNDVIYLGLCKAFEIVPHNIPDSKLESHRLDRWTTWWVRNWLMITLKSLCSTASGDQQQVVFLMSLYWDWYFTYLSVMGNRCHPEEP